MVKIYNVWKRLPGFIFFMTYAALFANNEGLKSNFSQEREYAVINGRILGDATDPLPGASVLIRSLNTGSSTDWNGLFTLNRVPFGTYTLEVTYLGFDSYFQEINVDKSEIDLGDIVLKAATDQLGEVVITANIEGQQRAYNLQKNADNIKNVVAADLINQFPDINVSEALQRVSGVTIERDRGEGATIRLRGTPQNYTTITVDGAQLPTTDSAGARTESLDLIPAELLASMEIAKAITPEMDGDAIAGTVSLKTPTARSKKGRIKGTVAGGYAAIFDRGTARVKLKMDKRFADNKFGVVLGGSYYNTINGEERYQAIYRIGEEDNPVFPNQSYLDEIQLRPLENERTRYGINGTFDYKFSDNSKIFTKFSFNSLEDVSERYRIRFRARRLFTDPENPNIASGDDTRYRKDIADNIRKRENVTLSFGGEHLINNTFKLDYGYTASRSERSNFVDRVVFRRRGVTYRVDRSERDFPQFIPLDFNPENYNEYDFSGFQRDQPASTQGFIQTATANLALPFNINNVRAEVKIGGKARLQSSSRERNNLQWGNFNGVYTLDQVLGEDQGEIFDGRYDLGAFPSPSRARRHFEDNFDLYSFNEQNSFENTFRDIFDTDEDVLAGYFQTKLNFGKLSVLAGARYEYTNASYNAFEVNAQDRTAIPTTGDQEFDFLLPNVHFTYKITDNTNARLAYTQSFARPNPNDLVPREDRNVANELLRLGNPDLQPAFANNLDFMFEHYFQKDGTISLGVFYKDIEDFIFESITFIDDPGGLFDGWERRQPSNGDKAELLGFEISAAKKFTFLPGFLSGFGVYANYTYTSSSSSLTFFDAETGNIESVRDDVPFVGQAEHVWNAALYYDKGRFSARASLNFNDNAFITVASRPEFDFFLEERYQLDANTSFKINDQFSVFAELQNLLDSPNIQYQSVRSQVTNYEIYGWSGRIGINFKF